MKFKHLSWLCLLGGFSSVSAACSTKYKSTITANVGFETSYSLPDLEYELADGSCVTSFYYSASIPVD
jgi:hypothetical protein